MPHRRSVKAQQRRMAKRLVLQSAFRDHKLSETINRMSAPRLITLLREKFAVIHMDFIDVEPGEVLIDSRGRGTLQQIQPGRR